MYAVWCKLFRNRLVMVVIYEESGLCTYSSIDSSHCLFIAGFDAILWISRKLLVSPVDRALWKCVSSRHGAQWATPLPGTISIRLWHNVTVLFYSQVDGWTSQLFLMSFCRVCVVSADDSLPQWRLQSWTILCKHAPSFQSVLLCWSNATQTTSLPQSRLPWTKRRTASPTTLSCSTLSRGMCMAHYLYFTLVGKEKNVSLI